MSRARRALWCVGLLSLPQLAAAQSGLLVPTSTGRADATVLSLREMTIDASIARGYTRVNVRQIFENHTDEVQEGTYRFSLAPSAAIGDFAVWDGMVRIPGVILEKRRARAIYDALNSQRVDPGLLQQGDEEDRAPGDGTAAPAPSSAAPFSVRVAPIPPRATKRLELQFQQEISVIGLRGEFRMALAPPSGEPLVARSLRIRVDLGGMVHEATANGLPLKLSGDGVTFEGTNVKLDRDLIVRFKLRDETPLRLSTFRNPDGRMPDGLALAPWERPSDIPPDRDGFFLMEVLPPAVAGNATPSATAAPKPAAKRSSLSLAILFDTSLSHRFSGLETSYQRLVRLLDTLTPEDKVALIPFDATVDAPTALANATEPARAAALERLRARPLSPGTHTLDALRVAQKLVGESDKSRIVLFTDGASMPSSKDLIAARKKASLFVSVAIADVGASLRAASDAAVTSLSSEPETDLFFERVLGPKKSAAPRPTGTATAEATLRVTSGDPGLHDIYPVLVQPPTPLALSGFVGRYSKPAAEVRFALAPGILPRESSTLTAAMPAKALEARDLPRRWARARVDDLLRRIEAEGERREWVDEIIELSRRYKFITPYTAFLAAPRSLLRPRRIQPGDPVLRVECDEGTTMATALFPFGLKLPLIKRPQSNVFEGRFLVPDTFKDGRYSVQIVMRDRNGSTTTESKTFVIDGKAPRVTPSVPKVARVGDDLVLTASTDDDVIFFSARVGNLPPVPLRWDKAANASIGRLHVPSSVIGVQEVVFEAVDLAKNVGFGRATIEVRP